MFERFTDRARRVVVLAQEESKLLNHDFIGTEHLLLALIHEGEGVGAKVLVELGLDLDTARGAVEARVGKGSKPQPTGHIPFTPRAKKALELSLREALQLGHNYIGTEHILLGIVRENDGVAAEVMRGRLGDLGQIRTKVLERISSLATEVQAEEAARPVPAMPSRREGGVQSPSPPGAPPLCPHCGSALAGPGQIGVRRLVAPAAEDLPATRVLAVYCGSCGRTLGVLQ